MAPPPIHNLDEAKQVIAELVETINKQQGQIAWLTRQMFGRKSERWSHDNQPGLFGDALTSAEPAEPVKQAIEYEREAPASNGRGKRQPIPDHLPREIRIHDLPEDEKTGMKRIGEEVSEQLALEPGRVYVIRHVRYTYARVDESLDPRGDSEPNVVTASKPDEGLPRCIAAPSLLAYVAVSKFADHLPLYRQEGILRRSGVNLSRSSMCRWMQELAQLCTPLLARMKNRVLQSHVIQADETPVKQQIGGKGPTKRCYFFSYVGDDDSGGPYIVYDYQQTRSRAGPNGWFTDEHGQPNYHGHLQCDAYAGYNDLFDAQQAWRMTHVGCLAHARRKFHDARMQFPGACHHVLAQIKLLYQVEREARDLEPAARRAMRQARSRPIFEALLNWCEDQQKHALPKSGLGEAITYTLNQARSLQRYLDDDRLAIDNNRCEASLRGIAIGRGNWMFTGSEAGGRAAAAMFSLISSARRHDVEPLSYLTDLFTRLPATPISQLDQFLPDRWQAPRN
jgi:transposase